MTEEAKKKRDELAEKHVNSFNPPIELNGDKQNCKLDFKQGFDAGYKVAMDEANERIQKLREALEFYASPKNWGDFDYIGGRTARAVLKEDDSKST